MKYGINRIDGGMIMPKRYGSVKSAVKAATEQYISLRFAFLRGSDLRGSDLSGANLFGANLIEADLHEADLSRADLSRANLSWANLTWANLTKADLSEANLTWADLTWADLTWADLFNCIGNGGEIKNINVGTYHITYTKDVLWVGCEHWPIEKARQITVEQARKIDGDKAAEFWAKNKDLIFASIDANPAI